jgi:3-phosphoshikimate 1-carboxyvinyltransferase
VWSRQPDIRAINLLGELGANTLPWELNGGDDGIGSESQHCTNRKTFQVSCAECPDGSIGVAAAACLARRPARLTGLRTLRVKETDRIAALANELRKVGCVVETGDDWIEITPPTEARQRAATVRERSGDRLPLADARGSTSARDPIIIETYNDHRMAMAFAVLGLAAPRITDGRPLAIRNPKCVAKSYPTFWKDFAKLYQ